MNYNARNKEAWEEAYDKRKQGWDDDICERLDNERHPFLEKELIDELQNHDLTGKNIAQFCCNNGRELLSIYKSGAVRGVGFDIAENMVASANRAALLLHFDCTFVAADILDIGNGYNDAFDYIFITIGALTWFKDLSAFFDKAAKCLKECGHVIINEMHPVINMLAMSREENFDSNAPGNIVNSYFKKEPWVEDNAAGYMRDPAKAQEKTFYSYSHTFADILNAISANGMQIMKLTESDNDISESFCDLSGKGIPLSYVLVAQKQ